MQPKAIQLQAQAAGAARFPAICAPLVGRTKERLLAEARNVADKGPDILEWRVDFFEGIADSARVTELAGLIKQAAGGIPLLFTRRSVREGGEPIALSEAQVVALYEAVCESGQVDVVDFEMGNAATDVKRVREVSRGRGVQLILSFHDFAATPTVHTLKQRFAQAELLEADIAKVAVMPRGMDDVLALLTATLQSSEELNIPLVSMSMGRLGAVTRMCGWAFGSAMTFAVGENSSAPGQLEIADVQAAVSLLQKAIRPQDL